MAPRNLGIFICKADSAVLKTCCFMLRNVTCLNVQMGFWPIRTIVDRRPALHTTACPSTRNFMCRALIKIVLGAALVGASLNASAQKTEPSPPVNSTVARGTSAAVGCIPAGTACKSTTLLTPTRAPISGQTDSVSYRGSDRVNPVSVQSPAAVESTDTRFSWRSIAALLSTLALIGTIALRRSRSGKT